MIKHIFLIFAVLLFVFSCSENKKDNPPKNSNIIENPEYGELQNSENPPVRFEQISSTDLSFGDDLIIGGIYAFTIDNDGNMYIVDSRQGKMVSLDPNGEFRFVTGQKGRGPGDLENVYSMAYHDGVIYLTNLSGARIDAFDLEGNFISSTTISKNINFGSIKGITEEDEFILRSVVWGELADDMFISKLTEDSVVISNTFRVQYSNGIEIGQGMSSSSDVIFKNGELIAGHLSDYILNFYDRNGEIQKSIRRDFDKIMPPGFSESNGGSTIMNMGGLNPSGVLSNGYLIVKVLWPTNITDSNEHVKKHRSGNAPDLVFANSLDIFDSNGTLLYSFEKEGRTSTIGNIIHIDNNDFIYTLSEDGSSLNKYKAIFSN